MGVDEKEFERLREHVDAVETRLQGRLDSQSNRLTSLDQWTRKHDEEWAVEKYKSAQLVKSFDAMNKTVKAILIAVVLAVLNGLIDRVFEVMPWGG